MKILLVNKYYYLRGGSEKYLFELEKLLIDKGHDVSIFSTRHQLNRPSSESEYFLFLHDFTNRSFLTNLWQLKNSIWSRIAKKKIKELIAVKNPDLVHLNNINFQLTPAIIAGIKEAGKPMVMTLHDYHLICPNHLLYVNGKECRRCLKGKYYHCLLNRCYKKSLVFSFMAMAESYLNHWRGIYKQIDLFISPSQYLKDRFVEAGFPENKIVVLPNFLNDFNKEKPREIIREDYYLYAGRISEEKGIYDLVDFFSQQPELKLKIAGTGDWGRYKQKVKNRKNIELLGWLQPADLKKIMAKAKAVIVPSRCLENCPFSILEAFAVGTPVIAKKTGSLPELIKEGENGFLYETNDELKKLFDRFSKIKLSPSFADRFKAENYYQELIPLYRKIIK